MIVTLVLFRAGPSWQSDVEPLSRFLQGEDCDASFLVPYYDDAERGDVGVQTVALDSL